MVLGGFLQQAGKPTKRLFIAPLTASETPSRRPRLPSCFEGHVEQRRTACDASPSLAFSALLKRRSV